MANKFTPQVHSVLYGKAESISIRMSKIFLLFITPNCRYKQTYVVLVNYNSLDYVWLMLFCISEFVYKCRAPDEEIRRWPKSRKLSKAAGRAQTYNYGHDST